MSMLTALSRGCCDLCVNLDFIDGYQVQAQVATKGRETRGEKGNEDEGYKKRQKRYNERKKRIEKKENLSVGQNDERCNLSVDDGDRSINLGLESIWDQRLTSTSVLRRRK